MSRVQTPTPAYNNACLCQLNYAHGDTAMSLKLLK